SHAVDVRAVEGGVRVRLARSEIAASARPLALRWRIDEPAWTPNVWVHQDPGHDGYFLLSLAAPPGLDDHVAPKDVTLVLDRSGTMEGAATGHAREAAADIIRRLASRDRVNVLAFDDDVVPLFDEPQPLGVDVRADALEFVERLTAGGGTDIAHAL